MATYVMSDIHGEYDMFMELLEKINLQETDTLYILGDILDRGPHPVKVLLKLMEMPNVVLLVGNHEVMAVRCLEFLCREITEENIAELNENMIQNIMLWQTNGGQTTIDEFAVLDIETQQEATAFIKDFIVYVVITVNDEDYLLVHAGLGNYSPDKSIDDYSLEELVWERPDYGTAYFDDMYTVTGHTPTQTIDDNPRPGYIYRKNNHIAIDCGACYCGGRLAAICLDTGEEFYSSENDCE